jgi:hypothetical protein
MERVKQLYDIYVARYSSTPYTPHQAEVYRKIRALADKCSSVEDMTVRLQDEGYNTMPAAALVADKLYAQMLAARENGLQRLEDIYKTAYEKVYSDNAAAYESGFYADVKRENERIAHLLDALCNCFDDYLGFVINQLFLAPDDVRFHASVLKDTGITLQELTDIPYFRHALGCDDDFIHRFVDEYGDIVAMESSDEESHAINDEASVQWEELSGHLGELDDSLNKNYHRTAVLCKAPATANGDYEYSDEAIEKLGDWL